MKTKAGPSTFVPIIAMSLVALGFVVLAIQYQARDDDTEIPTAPIEPAAVETTDTETVLAQAAPESQPIESAPEPAVTPAPEIPERYLDVIGSVPLDGDRLVDQIVLFFNSDLEPVSDESFQPLVLDPEIPGVYRMGRNFVAFKPYEAPENWVATVRLNPALRSIDQAAPRPDARFQFAAVPFTPRGIRQIDQSSNAITLGVSYPAALSGAEVLAHAVAVGADGANVPVHAQETADPSEVWLRVEGDGNWPVTLTLRAGLPSADGRLTQPEDFVYEFPQDHPLTIQTVEWNSLDRANPSIAIAFNEEVDAAQLAEMLRVTPIESGDAIPIEIATNGTLYRHVVRVQPASDTHAGFAVAVSENLLGSFGGRLPVPFQQDLAYPSGRLGLSDTWWDDHEADGYALSLNFTGNVRASDLEGYLEIAPEPANMRLEQMYGSRVDVIGDWDSERFYEVRIRPGLTSDDAGKLEQVITRRVRTEQIGAYLGFGLDGKYYFPRDPSAPIPIESRNLKSVNVSLHRMFPSNIAVALESMNSGEGGYQFTNSWSELIAEKDIDLGFTKDRVTRTPFTLAALMPEQRNGLYCIEAQGPEWHYGSKLVLMTDIGLLAHWHDDGLVLFAHNLYSLAPIGEAKVTAYSAKNQLLGEGLSNADGIVRLNGFDAAFGLPSVAVVESGDDYAFIELSPRGDAIPGITPEMPDFDRERYEAFVYADRDLYRPGETVHLQWLVRKNYGDAVSGVPLKLAIIKPNGQTLIEQPVTPSALGQGGIDFETQREYPTGMYTARLEVPGGETPLGDYEFKLEEFVPNQLRTTVTVNEPFWIAGNEYTFGVDSEHLAGGAARDRKTEGRVVLRLGNAEIPGWEGFRFGNDDPVKIDPVELGDAQTDENGHATFTVGADAWPDATQPLRALAVGRVFELGGRGVFGSAETQWFPSPTALGVAISEGDGRAVNVDVAAVNPDGTPADLAEVTVTLEKQIWNYYVRRYYSHHEPHWSESFEPVETTTVNLNNGRGNATFDASRYGYYRVRVHSEATTQYSTRSFYAFYRGVEVVDAARPSLIKVTLDKPEYAVGDEAIVRVESPFDGQGFVVIQSDDFEDLGRIAITNGVGEHRFTVTNDLFPNVWAGVTVVHAIEKDHAQVYPFSSFGMTSVKVVDNVKKLAVSFENVPEAVKPGTELALTVAVRDAQGAPVSGEVTIAAVDEGIHSITGFESPDPYAWVSRLRRPDHRRSHYYDKVAYDFEEPSASGDLDALLGKRAAAISENWIKPVSLWSGPVTTDANGNAAVTFPLPEFSGELRLVAVAYTNNAVGSHSTSTKVRRDHDTRVSLPRFLLPHDESNSRVVVFNRSDQPATATVSWESSGALQPESGSTELELPANGEATALVNFVAGLDAGDGNVTWRARIADATGNEIDSYERSFALPVRLPGAYQSHQELIELRPGDGQVFRNTAFVDDESTELEVFAGAQPNLQLADALDYVVGYPYGCIEQTVSRLMPMYLLRKSSAITDSVLSEQETLDVYLTAGIERLFAMQTPSGGLAMWPGGEQAYEYGSVYALHFLTLVENGREYALPSANLTALRNYVRRVSNDSSDASYPALFRRTYATYTLAMGGDTEAIQQIPRFDSVRVPRTGRTLLAAAVMRSTGDRARAQRYLATMPSIDWAERERGGTLSSPIRNAAMEMLAMNELGSEPEVLRQRANELTAFLRDNRYGNTQETAFVVAALAGYLDGIAENIDSASATIEAPSGTHTIQGGESFTELHAGPDGEFHILNTGQTNLFVSLTTRGVPATVDPNPVSSGMTIMRSFHINDGSEYPGETFEQAEAYVVGITLQCDYAVENVVLVDKLPAGFEIENPRLARDAMPGANLEITLVPTHQDVRDDRLVLAFDRVEQGTHQFYYIVRAVTPGSYQYPAVEAECMYDASIRARSTSGTMTVQGG